VPAATGVEPVVRVAARAIANLVTLVRKQGPLVLDAELPAQVGAPQIVDDELAVRKDRPRIAHAAPVLAANLLIVGVVAHRVDESLRASRGRAVRGDRLGMTVPTVIRAKGLLNWCLPAAIRTGCWTAVRRI
jgi:hypothetical protein